MMTLLISKLFKKERSLSEVEKRVSTSYCSNSQDQPAITNVEEEGFFGQKIDALGHLEMYESRVEQQQHQKDWFTYPEADN